MKSSASAGSSYHNLDTKKLTMKSAIVKGFLGVVGVWLLLLGLMSVLPSANNNGLGGGSGSGSSYSSGDGNGNPDGSNGMERILRRIESALEDIQTLKDNNAEMKRIIETGGSSAGGSGELGRSKSKVGGSEVKGGLGSDYEKTRRWLELDLKELWYSIRSHSQNPESAREIDFEQVKDIYK
jgi:hypothetical protein